jgi:hypothetical protein
MRSVDRMGFLARLLLPSQLLLGVATCVAGHPISSDGSRVRRTCVLIARRELKLVLLSDL